MKNFYILIFLILIGLNYNTKAATFSSRASGTWSVSTTWTVTAGTDSDGIPDSDDDVTINNGHSINMTTASHFAKSMTNNGTMIGNGKRFNIYGNFTNNGSASGIVLYIQSACIFTSSVYFNGVTSWWIYKNLTISLGTSVYSANTMAVNAIVNNLGTVNIAGGLQMNTAGKWINGAASTLTLNANCTSTGTLDASGAGNTVTYRGSASNQIKSATYYNLTLLGATSTTRTAQGNITVLNNLTINSGTGHTFNMNNFNLTVGGNWLNQSSSNVINQGTTTFNTSTSQTINRTSSGNEVFKNMVIGGSGTTLLGKAITINQSLTINSGVLDVSASNYSLNVLGNMVNNGTLNCRAGTVFLNGSTTQTISGTTNTQFYNLTLNNASGAIINSTQSLTNDLTVSSGNFNSNGNFILVSSSSKTARIAPVSGTFSGNMIIQKYVSSRVKNWHDLTSPVQGTTIYDWDDEMYMSGFSTQDIPAGITGVDGSAGGFKSVRTYNEPTAAYANVTNSTTVLTPGKGYMVWLSDNMNNWNAKTFDSRGVPNFGTKVINLTRSGSAGAYAGLNFIGNPFASAIDYSLVTKVNTDGHAYGYNDGVWTDYGTNAILTPHQGFWVLATGAGASISVPEACKSSNTTTSFHRSAPNYAIKLIYNSPSVEYFNEGTVNIEYNTSEKWDIGLDAIYFNSPEAEASTISFNTGSMNLLTNAISDDKDEAYLPLDLYSPKTGIYYIQPSILNLGSYKYAWIENTKTGEKFELTEAIPVNIETTGVNRDFVLRLSKSNENSSTSQSTFEKDITVFNTDNTLNIKSNGSDQSITSITIFDITGKMVFEKQNVLIEKNEISKFDISELNQGVYIVNVIDAKNHSISKKIIK